MRHVLTYIHAHAQQLTVRIVDSAELERAGYVLCRALVQPVSVLGEIVYRTLCKALPILCTSVLEVRRLLKLRSGLCKLSKAVLVGSIEQDINLAWP